METFSGKALRQHREARFLTREHVAIAIGRTAASIALYETGRVAPPAAIIGALAQTLDVPVGDLFAPTED